jgi:methyltransferase (TIGR00027 family)
MNGPRHAGDGETTMADRLVGNISDTARWVAAYRAAESERADALFHDPWAARLAGDHGRRIARDMSTAMRNGWPMVARTKLIDDLVLRSIAEGADRVLNLAAGLDTRPYRLDLPRELTWIEADLPALLDEKTRLLEGEAPRCRLLREKVDLSDGTARAAFLERALAGAQRALVLTEGLLLYLPEPTVRELAGDLRARAAVRWWIMDLLSPALLRMLERSTRGKLSDDARLQFAPANGAAYFEALGWRLREAESMFRAASRLRRLPWWMRPLALFPDPPPRNPGRNVWGAIVRYERHATG